MSRFDFTATPLNGLLLVQRKTAEDHRGFLSRIYCAEEFLKAGIVNPIMQINHTLTRHKGTVRGLHFQYAPHMEAKLVSCLKGEVFDVAVDLRRGSATFMQWHGVILSGDNRRSLYLPEGFAHGFQALTDDCELLYLHSAPYRPEVEDALNIKDPKLNISWPLPIMHQSERDRCRPFIDEHFSGATK